MPEKQDRRTGAPTLPPRRTLVLTFGRCILESGEPLERHLASAETFAALIKRHGWLGSPGPLDMHRVRRVFHGAFDGVGVRRLVEEARDAGEGDAARLATHMFDALEGIPAEVARLIAASPVPTLFPFDQPAFWKEFPRELLDELVVDYFALHHPLEYAPLVLLGLFVDEIVNVGAAPGRTAYSRRRVLWDRLRGALKRRT